MPKIENIFKETNIFNKARQSNARSQESQILRKKQNSAKTCEHMKTMNNLTISGVASQPPCGTTTRNQRNSLIRCDEGPTLRMSVLLSFYG